MPKYIETFSKTHNAILALGYKAYNYFTHGIYYHHNDKDMPIIKYSNLYDNVTSYHNTLRFNTDYVALNLNEDYKHVSGVYSIDDFLKKYSRLLKIKSIKDKVHES